MSSNSLAQPMDAPRVYHRNLPEDTDHGFLPEVRRKKAVAQAEQAAAAATAPKVSITAPEDVDPGSGAFDPYASLDHGPPEVSYANVGLETTPVPSASQSTQSDRLVCVKITSHQHTSTAKGGHQRTSQRWERRLLEYQPRQPRPFDLKCTFGLPRSLTSMTATGHSSSPRRDGGYDADVPPDSPRKGASGYRSLSSLSMLGSKKTSMVSTSSTAVGHHATGGAAPQRSHQRRTTSLRAKLPPVAETPEPYGTSEPPSPSPFRSESAFGRAFSRLDRTTHDVALSDGHDGTWCFADVVAPKSSTLGSSLPSLASRQLGAAPTVAAAKSAGKSGAAVLSRRDTFDQSARTESDGQTSRFGASTTNERASESGRGTHTRQAVSTAVAMQRTQRLKSIVGQLDAFLHRVLPGDIDSDDEAAMKKKAREAHDELHDFEGH